MNNSKPETYLHRNAVVIFCSLTIVLSFATYLLPLPREALAFVMVLVPAITAITLTAITEGSKGVHALLGKLIQWRIGLKWYGIALLLALALRLSVSLLAVWSGSISTIRLRSMTLPEVLLLAVIFIVAALLEELGWRGYALRQLLKRYTPWFASLVIGVLWGVVHLALHLPGMPNAGYSGWLTILQLTGLSVLITWFFINAGNNVLLAAIFHAAQSFFVILNEGVSMAQQMWLMAIVWCAAALLIIITSRVMRKIPGYLPN